MRPTAKVKCPSCGKTQTVPNRYGWPRCTAVGPLGKKCGVQFEVRRGEATGRIDKEEADG